MLKKYHRGEDEKEQSGLVQSVCTGLIELDDTSEGELLLVNESIGDKVEECNINPELSSEKVRIKKVVRSIL